MSLCTKERKGKITEGLIITHDDNSSSDNNDPVSFINWRSIVDRFSRVEQQRNIAHTLVITQVST